MSRNLFDAGDFQRLDRESQLLEQSERQPIEEDRSPPESPIDGLEEQVPDESQSLQEMILDRMFEVLKERF